MGNSNANCLGTCSEGDTPTKNNGDMRSVGASLSYGPPAVGDARFAVQVRVYNLQPAVKKGKKHMTTSLGFGFFHSAVEVFGREWQFGGNESASPEDCGIFYLPPEMVMPSQQVYEVITVGYLPKEATNAAIEKGVREQLLPMWTALSYHILSHNCNHFAEAFVSMLNGIFGLKMEVPSYINRAARFGDVFVPDAILRQMMQQAPQAPGQSNGGGGGGSNNKNKNPSASPSSPSRKLGHNPTLTKDGKHYTLDGVPLKDFQGYGNGGGQQHSSAGGCRCGNPYCRNNPDGIYGARRQHSDVAAEEPAVVTPSIPTDDEMKSMPVRSLKTVMWLNGISWEGCVEKEDLVSAVRRYREELNAAATATSPAPRV